MHGHAYHALPPLARKSDGLPTGAVHGFCGMLNKLLREMKKEEAPTHLAIIFDKSEAVAEDENGSAIRRARPRKIQVSRRTDRKP